MMSSDIRIIHGSNCGNFPVNGASIGSVRNSLIDAFNLPARAVAFVNGQIVCQDHRLIEGDILEFIVPWGRKGAFDGSDNYFIDSRDSQLKLNEILFRIGRLEETISEFTKQQAPAKELYTVDEFGKLTDLSPYTVREHCRLGRLNATKAVGGRGGIPEWRISHAELIRFRSHGLLPLRKN